MEKTDANIVNSSLHYYLNYALKYLFTDIDKTRSSCGFDDNENVVVSVKDNTILYCNNLSEFIICKLNEINKNNDKIFIPNFDKFINEPKNCLKCKVNFLCHSSCPFSRNNKNYKLNCLGNKAFYGSIVDFIFNKLKNS